MEFSNSNIKKAILVLKNASPEDYQNLCRYVDTIDPNLSCGGFEGGCYYGIRSKTIDVSTSRTSLSWTAAVIGHETCHAMQAKEGRPLDETECYKVDSRILKTIVEF